MEMLYRRVCFNGGFIEYIDFTTGDCEANVGKAGEDQCKNKGVLGLEFNCSHGEHGPIFICLSCLNELLKGHPNYVPGYMIGEGT